MSKKNTYVSPSVEAIDVDSDINVCAMSGGTVPVVPEPWPDDEEGDGDETIF